MSLRFVIGGSGAGKTTRLYREVIEDSIRRPESRFFVIVPEQFTLQTQKDIVMMHPNRGVMNIDILSFERLAYRVFEEMGAPSLTVLDDMGKAMAIRKLSGGLRKDLALFGTRLDKPGFINEIKSQLSEFFQYGIEPEDLTGLMETSKSAMLRGKLADLQKIYRAYREFTGDDKIARDEIPELLCRYLPDSGLLRGSDVALDGFTGFTPVQYAILSILLRICRRVTVTVTMDPALGPYRESGEQELFHLSRHTISRLIRLAEETNCARERDVLLEEPVSPRFAGAPGLQHLERNLFRPTVLPMGGEQGDIKLICAQSPAAEIRDIAAEIRRLVMEEGYRYRDIAVIAGDLASYAGEIAHQFDRNGIPYFMDRKKSILENPATELIRAAVEVLFRSFAYEPVFRMLKTGLFLPEDAPEEGLFYLENYAAALGIRGFGRWNQEWDRTYGRADLIDLALINRMRESVIRVMGPFKDAFARRGVTVRERTEALVHLLMSLSMEEKLKKRADGYRAAGDAVLAEEYDQVYPLIMDLFDRITALLGDEKMSVKEYSDILDAGFAEIKVGLIPASVDRVVVGDLTRSRLAHVKALFFAGLNDGIVPSVAPRGGVFTEAERRLLKEANVELAPSMREEGFQQRFYLYLAMTKPERRLFLCRSAASADGKELRPSVLLTRVKEIFPDLAEEAPDETENAVYSLPSALEQVAAGLAGDGEKEENAAFGDIFRSLARSPEHGGMVDMLLDAAFYTYDDRGIGKKAARALYGSEISGSVTRMELYAACPYAHFLQYGLSLSEREEYMLNPADMGNVFHGALEMFFRRLAEEKKTPADLREEERNALIRACLADAAGSYGNAILGSSARNRYLAGRMSDTAERTIWAVTRQLEAGDFRVAGLEMDFGSASARGSLSIPLGDEGSVSLKGRIDRVDICRDGDNIFLRIIDYKTGSTSFDLQSVYYGLQMQLVVYMQAAMEQMKARFPGKNIRPAGLFYYRISDPLIERRDRAAEDREMEILRKLRPDGLASADAAVLGHMDRGLTAGITQSATVDSIVVPVDIKKGEVSKKSAVAGEDDLMRLSGHVRRTIGRFGREILSGGNGILPYRSGTKTGCDYCRYKVICGFDPGIGGFRYRKLADLEPDEIWRKIGEETQDGGQDAGEGGNVHG